MSRNSVICQVAALCVLGGLLAASLALNQPIRFPLDDAYITIANAELLLRGGTDSYGHSQATGATSPFHFLMLAFFGFFAPLPVANLVLAALAAVLYVLGLLRLFRTIGLTAPLGVLACLVCLCYGAVWYQLLNGLETGIALAALVWTLSLLQVPPGTRPGIALAVLLGLLPFIRPELALVSLLALLGVLWRARQSVSSLVLPAVCGLATVLLCAALSWWATGTFIPRTAGAKEAFFAEAGLPLADKAIWAAEILFFSQLLPVFLGLVFLPGLRGGWAMIGLAGAIVLAAILTLPSALGHNHFRYLYVLLPLGVIGWAVAAGQTGRTGWIGRGALALLGLLAVVQFPVLGWQMYRNGLAVTEDQERLATWASAGLPPGSRVLIHDAGYFGWRTAFPLVDLVGLKTPEVIELHRRHTLPSQGRDRGKVIDMIARQGGVTHAIILQDPFWSRIADDLRHAGWQLEPLRTGEDLRYQLFRLEPPAP